MNSISKAEYLCNPCRYSSIPYWKTKSVSIPDTIQIIHESNYKPEDYRQYIDEPYFRLYHDMKNLSKPTLAQGFSLCKAEPGDFAKHINSCYQEIGITETELRSCQTSALYNAAFWLAVRDDHTNEIIATAIGELDKEIREGILEWIQVSDSHRRKGLGHYLVSELLWRMKDTARFVTVSGQCHNPANPEGMYRKCGFTGNDVWHILRKRATVQSEPAFRKTQSHTS